MSPTILVVEHEAKCPPAHVGTWLADAGCRVEVCRPWAGDALPDPTSYDALVVLGGSMSAHDDATHPWLAPVKEMFRTAGDRGTPALGICLGHQLAAVAFGATVEPNPRGQQLGVLDVGWLPTADAEPLFAEARPARGIQWNDDVLTALPDGAVLLAATGHEEPQVVRFADTVWGVQLHPEADEHVVGEWALGDRDRHLERGVDQAALLRQVAGVRAELDAGWRPVFDRFAQLARAGAGSSGP